MTDPLLEQEVQELRGRIDALQEQLAGREAMMGRLVGLARRLADELSRATGSRGGLTRGAWADILRLIVHPSAEGAEARDGDVEGASDAAPAQAEPRASARPDRRRADAEVVDDFVREHGGSRSDAARYLFGD